MGRIAIQELIEKDPCFNCPDCRGKLKYEDSANPGKLVCYECSSNFSVWNNIPVLLPKSQNKVKGDIQKFWGELYKAAYEKYDANLDSHKFLKLLGKLKELFRHRQHLAVTEMPIDELSDKTVLEIGSGAGAHTALFADHGARMFSMDITHDRVVATAGKLDLIDKNSNNVCLQGDAEKLPFPDNYFDIVYSNGVLHHSPDTPLTIKEAYRVLKPGGEAVIMLYARDSFYYWFVIFFLRGVLTGNIFRHKNWLGRVTEWMSAKRQTIMNPETKVYSKIQINRLFSQFKQVNIRKNSFIFEQIPIIGKLIARMVMKKTGINEAGQLIYGHGWRNESHFELLVSKYMGFALNIKAKK